MHDAFHRAVRVVANRIEQFLRLVVKLSHARYDLTRNRIHADRWDRSAPPRPGGSAIA